MGIRVRGTGRIVLRQPSSKFVLGTAEYCNYGTRSRGRGPNKHEKGRDEDGPYEALMDLFKRPQKLQFENPPNLFGSRRVARIFSMQTALNISPSRKSFILLSILNCKYFKKFQLSIWISWSQSYSCRVFYSISCFESLSTDFLSAGDFFVIKRKLFERNMLNAI